MDNTEKALQVLIDAEIKETDFKNEAVYNTVVGNLIKIFENTDKLKNSIFNKNKSIFDLENKLERRDIMIKDLDNQITVLQAEIEKKEAAIYQWKGAVNDLESEKQTLTEICDSATARLNDSTDFNIKLHIKNRDLRNEIERECKNFGEFIGHNFSTTNHAERWECDNTHELYDIEEIYAKYIQHTQAGRV